MFGLMDARPEPNLAIAQVKYDKGHHGGNRGQNDNLSPDDRLATEKCLFCILPDSADHWLHNASSEVNESFETLSAVHYSYKLRSVGSKVHYTGG